VQPDISQPSSSCHKMIQWEKPSTGQYKCNIDASFSSSMNQVGIGMCICNDAGEFVLAKIAWFAPLSDVDIREAVGLHTTLEWTSGLQFHNIDFVLDSKKVVDAFTTDVGDNSEFDCIIDACSFFFLNKPK